MHTHLHVEYVYICFIQTLSKIATKGVSSTDMYVNAPITSDPGKDIQVWKFVTLSLGYFHMSFRKNILNPMNSKGLLFKCGDKVQCGSEVLIEINL